MSDAAEKKKKPKQLALVEVKGVRLKHFEQVLAKLLSDNALEPRYIALPSIVKDKQPDWDAMPSAARVQGELAGQLSNPQRAKRKEDQIKSMIQCIYALLPTKEENISQGHTIVDFGGGSGHLSIPLALFLPNCTIVVVDLKQKSLSFLHEKATACMNGKKAASEPPSDQPLLEDGTSSLRPTAIPNLFTFSGDIESYQDPFHIGVALHVCGEATDVVLRKCAQNKAHLVVAPCCVGKLSSVKKDPYIYHATNQNTHTIQYPQSQKFQQCLQCNNTVNDWNALAKAADFNEYLDMNQRRNASKRTAKGLLELDRQLFLQEAYSYQTALTRMDPLAASPKNDILMGYYMGESGTTPNPLLDSSQTEEDPIVTWTKAHLLHPGAAALESTNMVSESPDKKKLKTEGGKQGRQDGVDWTVAEEEAIRNQLTECFSIGIAPVAAATDSIGEVEAFVFPTGMGRRKRKLIHFVADQLGLAHWCVGKKHAEKTVAVRRRRVKKAEFQL